VLAEILLKLHERSLRLWFISLAAPDHRGSVNDQHHRIFQAIGHRDVVAAENAMRVHIDSFRRNVLRSL
jgi:FCD domain.